MDYSKFLSKVIGLYLLIVSIAMLTNINRFHALVIGLLEDAPLLFVLGLFTLVIGVLMVVSHSMWVKNWRVLVTIVSWLTLFKGMCILFNPGFFYFAAQQFSEHMYKAWVVGYVDLVLGLIFIYFGFRKKS